MTTEEDQEKEKREQNLEQLDATFSAIYSNRDITPEERQRFLAGLISPEEIEFLVKRGEIREAIYAQLKNEDFRLSQIAARCKASMSVVNRVWHAILVDYPINRTAAADFTIAIPKEKRALKPLKEILADAGFAIREESKLLVDVRGEMESVPIIMPRASNIPWLMKSGGVQIGFVGNDILKEIIATEELVDKKPASFRYIADFREASFRMCMAVRRSDAETANTIGLDFVRMKKIMTPYKSITEKFLRDNGIKAEVEYRKEADELIQKSDAAAIVDVVETGESLRRNDLVVFGDPLFQGKISLCSLQEASFSNDNEKRLGRIRERLIMGAQPLQALGIAAA